MNCSKELAAIVLIAVVGIAAYSNTLHAPFVYDDLGAIVNNLDLQQLDLGPLSNYFGLRALPQMSLVANFRLGGLNVLGYHLVNLVIHIVNGLLVYWLSSALGR